MPNVNWTKPIECQFSKPFDDRCTQAVFLSRVPEDGLVWVSVDLGNCEGWQSIRVDELTGLGCVCNQGCRIRNVPEKRRLRGWVNVYDENKPYSDEMWETREEADAATANYRIACIYIDQEFVVGEGLDE